MVNQFLQLDSAKLWSFAIKNKLEWTRAATVALWRVPPHAELCPASEGNGALVGNHGEIQGLNLGGALDSPFRSFVFIGCQTQYDTRCKEIDGMIPVDIAIEGCSRCISIVHYIPATSDFNLLPELRAEARNGVETVQSGHASSNPPWRVKRLGIHLIKSSFRHQTRAAKPNSSWFPICRFTTNQASSLPTSCLCHQRPRMLKASSLRGQSSKATQVLGLNFVTCARNLDPHPARPSHNHSAKRHSPRIRTHARISRLRWNWARFGVRPIGGPKLLHPSADQPDVLV